MLSLPTDKAIQSFQELTRTWEAVERGFFEREVATKIVQGSARSCRICLMAWARNLLGPRTGRVGRENNSRPRHEALSGTMSWRIAGIAGGMGGATGKAAEPRHCDAGA